MKRTLLTALLRFAVTVSIAWLLMFFLLRLWPYTDQSSGYSTVEELKSIFIAGSRSTLLIALALLFSTALTTFSLLFSTRFRRPRFLGLGIKCCLYIISAIPTIFVGYLALELSSGGAFVLGDDVNRFHYYLLPALVLGVGDGFLNEFIQHAEAEFDAIRREHYVRMGKAIGVKIWQYIRNDFIVHSSRIAFSRMTALVSGTVVVELVFNLPGLGLFAINAAERGYVERLMLILFVMVVGVSLLNLMYRVMAVILDPRLR